MINHKMLNPILIIIFISFIITPPSNGQNCLQYTFPGGRPSYPSCTILPSLSSFLHWRYHPSNRSVNVAYRHASVSSSQWVVWSLNPGGGRMIGAQCLVAFQNSSGLVSAYTSPINSYSTSMPPGPLSFAVSDLSAELSNSQITIYATIQLPAGKTAFTHLWQDGGMRGDTPRQHSMSGSNLRAYGTIDFATGGSSPAGGGSGNTGGGDGDGDDDGDGDNNGGNKSGLQSDGSAASSGAFYGLDERDIHGLLNAASWGLLMPLGVMSARYLKVFKSANPAWFYIHATCQVLAYILGVAGWATGLHISEGAAEGERKTHRNIGLVLFMFGTLQVLALLLRPKPDHKYRRYWNIYHHSIGYSVIGLGIFNIFGGLDLLDPAQKWKKSYIYVLIILGVSVAILEPLTWIIVLRRRRRGDRPTKYQQPTGNGSNGADAYA